MPLSPILSSGYIIWLYVRSVFVYVCEQTKKSWKRKFFIWQNLTINTFLNKHQQQQHIELIRWDSSRLSFSWIKPSGKILFGFHFIHLTTIFMSDGQIIIIIRIIWWSEAFQFLNFPFYQFFSVTFTCLLFFLLSLFY